MLTLLFPISLLALLIIADSTNSPHKLPPALPVFTLNENVTNTECLSQLTSTNASRTTPSFGIIDYGSRGPAPHNYTVAFTVTLNAPDVDSFTPPFTFDRRVWMSVDKAVDYTSQTLPFTPCLLSFNGLPLKVSQPSIGPSVSGDTTTCDLAQTSAKGPCFADLVKMVTEMANNLTQGTEGFGGVCQDVAELLATAQPPDSCEGMGDDNGSKFWSAPPDVKEADVDTIQFETLTDFASPTLDICNITDLPSDFYKDLNGSTTNFNVFPVLNDSQPLSAASNYSRGIIMDNYDLQKKQIDLIMRVDLPAYLDDVNRTAPNETIASAVAYMDCLRIEPVYNGSTGVPTKTETNTKTSGTIGKRNSRDVIGFYVVTTLWVVGMSVML